jgi:YesN/AraC family two-component response regulator
MKAAVGMLQNSIHPLISSKTKSYERALAELSIHAQLLEFITDLCQFFFQQTKQTYLVNGTSTQFALAHEAASLLESAINEPIKIQELAGKLNVNHSYLSECFKKIYGISPRSYWAQARTREAKRWLQKRSYPSNKSQKIPNFLLLPTFVSTSDSGRG